jgi:hypothetical protein
MNLSLFSTIVLFSLFLHINGQGDDFGGHGLEGLGGDFGLGAAGG